MKNYIFLALILTGGIMAATTHAVPRKDRAIFAGGCFWCMEPPFEKLDGVQEVISGYMGGTGENPTYQDYAQKGHIEVVEVVYYPDKISYDTLLDTFWCNIDPTDADGQFVDRGKQYSSAIFYRDDQQKKIAEASKKALVASKRYDKPIVTPILPASTFYKAEEYHQNYYKEHPYKYKFYRSRSGRDTFINKHCPHGPIPTQAEVKKPTGFKPTTFKKPTDAELRKQLTPMQYKVTQKDGTEPPFDNEYNDNKRAGIYVDIVSGEPLFSSLDKYDSKTGWPSFTQPLEPTNIVEKLDKGWFTTRTEIRSKHADSHLGHVFKDGPPPTGLRYCMNSAALRFIPVADLEKEGYGSYASLFLKKTS